MFKYLKNQIETSRHKLWVFWYCLKFSLQLIRRGIKHDWSKYKRFEARRFEEYVNKLKGVTYGSEEYQFYMDKLRPAILHHYIWNSHHPEYHGKDGFKAMGGLDRIEMIMDWLAATKRHADGDINKSIEINQKRFGYSDEDKAWLKAIIGDVKLEKN